MTKYKNALYLILVFVNILITLSGIWSVYVGIVTHYLIPVLAFKIPEYILGIMILYFALVNYVRLYKSKKNYKVVRT